MAARICATKWVSALAYGARSIGAVDCALATRRRHIPTCYTLPKQSRCANQYSQRPEISPQLLLYASQAILGGSEVGCYFSTGDQVDRAKLKAQLIVDEGKKSYAYQDSEGFLTIGVGHLIDRRKGGRLSDAAIDFVLNEDIDGAYSILIAALPWVAVLDDARQNVLTTMTFNLGLSGLMEFKQTLEFVKSGDYHGAAKAMLKSLWAVQVGDRAKRLSKIMETGVLP